jgi:hypothetical protein
MSAMPDVLELDPAEQEAARLRAMYGPLADLFCEAALESEAATPRQRAEVLRIRLALHQDRPGGVRPLRRHG